MVRGMDLETVDFEEGSDGDFASMLEDSFKKQESTESFVEGIIARINEDRVLIDVGKKEEGDIALSEILDEDGKPMFKEGDKINVVITGYKGERPRLSHRAAIANKAKQDFIEAHKDNFEDLTLKAKIIKKNKGGYIASDNGIEFFLPRSQAMLNNNSNNIGKTIEAKILKIEHNNIVISRLALIKERQSTKEKRIKELMENDAIIEGSVKNIVSYGMFVDIGENIIGLVHYNEISYKGAVNPAKYFQIGDVVNVKIVDFDNKKGHLSLSIKATMSDPWEDISELGEGDVISVTVSNIEPYGVFVDLGNDIEGFLHISEISWDKSLKHPKDILEVGQELNVEVIEIDKEKKKLRVSYKALQPKPIELFAKKYKKDDTAKGKVVEIKDFGAFINIDGVEGLLANQNCDWQKNKKCKDVVNIGDEVEVKIIDLNTSNSKISLSLKDLKTSPAGEFAKTHKVGDIVNATIAEKKDFGIFVEIQENEALIRTDDLYPLKADELNKGDNIEAVVSMIDAKENRIRLSVRRLERQKEKEILSQINNNDKMTLGDILKDNL